MTDFEMEHLSQWSMKKNGDKAIGKPKDILIDGLGVHPEPSPENPFIMQAGARSGISEHFEKRNFPYEVTAYMYQGNFSSTTNLSEKPYTKDDLQNIEADETYRNCAGHSDPYLVSLKTKYQHYADFKDHTRIAKEQHQEPVDDKYKWI